MHQALQADRSRHDDGVRLPATHFAVGDHDEQGVGLKLPHPVHQVRKELYQPLHAVLNPVRILLADTRGQQRERSGQADAQLGIQAATALSLQLCLAGCTAKGQQRGRLALAGATKHRRVCVGSVILRCTVAEAGCHLSKCSCSCSNKGLALRAFWEEQHPAVHLDRRVECVLAECRVQRPGRDRLLALCCLSESDLAEDLYTEPGFSGGHGTASPGSTADMGAEIPAKGRCGNGGAQRPAHARAGLQQAVRAGICQEDCS